MNFRNVVNVSYAFADNCVGEGIESAQRTILLGMRVPVLEFAFL